MYPTANPMTGDRKSQSTTLCNRLYQFTAENELLYAMPPPTSAPISACDELLGIAKYQVSRFHTMDEISTHIITH